MKDMIAPQIKTFLSRLTRWDCCIKLSNVCIVIVRSVGCTVIEMLTSCPPLMDHGNEHLSLGQRMYIIEHRELKPPGSCSPLVCRFLERCLSDREERPSASELLETDDFVKFLSDWQINPLPLNVITVTGVDLIFFFALTHERLSHLSISGLLRSYLVEMMKKNSSSVTATSG